MAPDWLTKVAWTYVLMRVGTIVGFFTSWPGNGWLVRRGVKVPM